MQDGMNNAQRKPTKEGDEPSNNWIGDRDVEHERMNQICQQKDRQGGEMEVEGIGHLMSFKVDRRSGHDPKNTQHW
jgi:hypothetical protein